MSQRPSPCGQHRRSRSCALFLLEGAGVPECIPGPLLAVGVVAGRRRHTGAAHGDGHILLSVDSAAACAARCAAQHHGGQQHGRTAQAQVLLAAWARQAAAAQAVGLGQEPREAGGVVGDPAGRGRQPRGRSAAVSPW